jgi:hypothetical protein
MDLPARSMPRMRGRADMKARAAKISKTTPCKVTGSRLQPPEKQLDPSGKSPSLLHHSELASCRRPATAGASLCDFG